MYHAKSSTKGLRVYEPDLESDNPHPLTLVAELRTALNTGQIEVHVQPQARTRTGEVGSVEALVRWRHPERGPSRPTSSFPWPSAAG